MKYSPLFEIRLQHTYYNDGRCVDFEIQPDAKTIQLLKNYRAVLIPLSDGMRVVTVVTESGDAFIPFTADIVLGFELRLLNPQFQLVTDQQAFSALISPLYSNATLSGESEKELDLISNEAWGHETFQVVTPASEESFVLRNKPLEGLTKTDFTIETSGQVSAVATYSEADKLISVDSQMASEGESFTVKYPSKPKMPKGTFALIEIHMNDSLPNLATPQSVPRQFQISFQAKQATWVYYCVTDLENIDTDYQIVDAPPVDEDTALAFSAANRRNLATDPDPLDDFSQELAERYPSLKRYRFLSDAPVDCRQKAHKHLSLQVNGNKVTAALPNPSFRNFSTGRVMVGDTLQQQDWLYEVVKVLTQ